MIELEELTLLENVVGNIKKNSKFPHYNQIFSAPMVSLASSYLMETL